MPGVVGGKRWIAVELVILANIVDGGVFIDVLAGKMLGVRVRDDCAYGQI
jgi:hypothetical protein